MEKLKQKTNEILIAHDLDFTIHKAPMVALMGGGQVESPYFGLINSKTNQVINTVKKGYTVSQNEEIVRMVLTGMEPFGDKLNVTKAGSLNGGRKVYLQLGIEGNSHVNGDVIKRYVTVIDSNDGSCSLSIGIGDKTMSCINMFARFYKSGSKFRHTATIEQKMKEIPMLIETALRKSLKQVELYQHFASTAVTANLADQMVKHILGFDRVFTSAEILGKKTARSIEKMDSLYDHITKEMASKGQNIWGLHSGVTSYTTHEVKKPKRVNGDYESLLLGSSYLMNQKSLQFAMAKSGASALELA